MTLLLIGIIIFAALGVADGLYLVNLKIEDEATGSAASRICEAVSETGCSVALESPVSAIGPVPISLIGVATYIVVIVLALRWWSRRHDDDAREGFEGNAIAAIATGSVLLSMALAGYSAAVGSWCLFCIGLYVVNLALLALVSVALERNPLTGIGRTLGGVFSNLRAVASTFGLFLVVLGVGQFLLGRQIEAYAGERLKSDRTRMQQSMELGSFAVDLDSLPTAGPADAPLTLVKFSDFECPFCKKMWTGLEELRGRHPELIRVAFNHSPLAVGCNPMMRPFHKRACEAAYAAECAHQQGKFFEMADTLFANQPEFDDDALKGYAEAIGLDMTAWSKCLASDEMKTKIQREALFARAVGAAGTPGALIVVRGQSEGLFFNGGFGPASVKTLAKELPALVESSPPPESPLVLARRAALEAGRKGAPTADRALIDTPVKDDVLELVMAVDPVDAAGREQVDTAVKLAVYFTQVARVKLVARPKIDCSDPKQPECLPSAILACGTRIEDKLSRASALNQLATAKATDLSGLATTLGEKYPEFSTCMDDPSTALSDDMSTVVGESYTRDRPHIWVDSLHFDGPLTRQEIESHIAAVLLERRR